MVCPGYFIYTSVPSWYNIFQCKTRLFVNESLLNQREYTMNMYLYNTILYTALQNELQSVYY